MEKKDVLDLQGKTIKIILNNSRYYKGELLSVGDDFVKIRDINSTITFIKLEEIGILEVIG